MYKKTSSRRGAPVDTTIPGYASPTDTTSLGQAPTPRVRSAPQRASQPPASQPPQVARADPEASSASESSSDKMNASPVAKASSAGGVALGSRKPFSSRAPGASPLALFQTQPAASTAPGGNAAASGPESDEARRLRKLKQRQEDVASHARKRSRNPKARSMGGSVPIADFRRLLEQERQACEREEPKAVRGPGAEDEEATIAFYRDRYAGNFKTDEEVSAFCRRFDACVAEWKVSGRDAGDLEAALKGYNRSIRKELAGPGAVGMSGAQPSGSRGKSPADPASTTDALPSPRTRRFREYGFSESEKRKKEEIENFSGTLKKFMEQAECAEDFRDDEFREAYAAAAWKQFDAIAMQDSRQALRTLFEEEILKHFIASFSLSSAAQGSQSSHPHIRQLESALRIWRAQPRSKKEMLTSETLYAIWGRLERDRAIVANFKAGLSAQDKGAQAGFVALDAEIDRWRLDQANSGKPLNGRSLAAIWQGLAPQGNEGGGPGSPRSPQPKEKERAPDREEQETPQKRERKTIEMRCADFMGKPENPHFGNPAFRRAFLESVAGRRTQIGMAVFQPENLQKLYTGVQVSLFWKQRAEAGWPDAARLQLERLVHAKCEALGNHVADEEQFEEYRKLVMMNARAAVLGGFLASRLSYQSMELRSQASFRQSMSNSVDAWILNGAHGTVHDILVSIYQDKLIDAFKLVKRSEGEGDKTGYLPRWIDDWTAAHPGTILEWDALQALWDGIGDTSALDALARHDTGMGHPPSPGSREDS